MILFGCGSASSARHPLSKDEREKDDAANQGTPSARCAVATGKEGCGGMDLASEERDAKEAQEAPLSAF